VKILPVFCLAIGLILTACQKESGVTLQQPGIGALHGSRISIPPEYQFFPVEYVGDDIWARPPKRHDPGPEVPIRSFSILLHLPDFAPRNQSNEASWIGANRGDAHTKEWINVDVQPLDNIDTKNSHRWFSEFFITRQMDGQISWTRGQENWYFVRQENQVFGLINEKKVGPDYSIPHPDNTETFYDPARGKVYIVCGTGAGFKKYCHQYFIIPELSAVIDVFYEKNNLSSWETIQKKVNSLVLSFHVDSSRNVMHACSLRL
jgi:hypothetical protein